MQKKSMSTEIQHRCEDYFCPWWNFCFNYMTYCIPSSLGLHYIGQLHENSLLRIAFDQISEGQLEFQKLNQHFDTIFIGPENEKRQYTIISGKTEMKAHLLKQFPNDTEAIETFFKIMKVLVQSLICPKCRPVHSKSLTNFLHIPTDLCEEDALSGNSKADPSVVVFIPAEVGHCRPHDPSFPPFWHMCNRLCKHPDQKQGSPTYLCVSFLW